MKTFYKSKWTGLVIFFFVSVSLKQLTFSHTLPNKHLIGLTFNKKMNMFVSMTALKSIFFYMLLKEKKSVVSLGDVPNF